MFLLSEKTRLTILCPECLERRELYSERDELIALKKLIMCIKNITGPKNIPNFRALAKTPDRFKNE